MKKKKKKKGLRVFSSFTKFLDENEAEHEKQCRTLRATGATQAGERTSCFFLVQLPWTVGPLPSTPGRSPALVGSPWGPPSCGAPRTGGQAAPGPRPLVGEGSLRSDAQMMLVEGP